VITIRQILPLYVDLFFGMHLRAESSTILLLIKHFFASSLTSEIRILNSAMCVKWMGVRHPNF